ncbi:AMP-binding protein [Thioflexithrix psekupsensis]|uniref:AMP-binding protein n=1 Tax=Thioflexithrix psekupsensis TaxID=1570016 RepID=UPI001593155F|nr:AMP-binding protein [Thioflexithrix psekupsensis]
MPLRSQTDDYRIQAAQVTEIITPQTGEQWMQPSFTPIISDDIALINFTSGTEGQPKGVLLTHRNLADVVQRLNHLMHVDHSISEYIGVPVYHSFGLGRCRAVASAGGRFFIPHHFNPAEIAHLLQADEINAISAVPSLWRILLAHQEMIGDLGKKVKWIEIGSQYMSLQEKQAMQQLFPHAKIIQHYGLTEASRSTLLEIHKEQGELLDSVGTAMGDVEITLTPEHRIAIRGPHVAANYLIDGQEKALKDSEGWLITSDMGDIKSGYLYYKGRADDVINCGGIKVSPELLETQVYAALSCQEGLAVCRTSDALYGDGFLIALTPACTANETEVYNVVLEKLQQMNINATSAIHIIHLDQLPKTDSGKVQRRAITAQYTPEAQTQTSPSLQGKTAIQTIFCNVLKLKQLKPEDSFVSLGGDSLSYVQLSMLVERELGYLPPNWERVSLAELDKLVPEKSPVCRIESSVLLRALAIVSVVFNHAGFSFGFSLSGGAMLLFLVAGLNFSRFQWPQLLQGKLLSPIISLLQNLVVPYLIVALIYQTHKGYYDPAVLLLYGNLLGTDTQYVIFPAWFIQLLVQCIVIFTVILAIPQVRNWAKYSPWHFGLILLAIAIVLRLTVPDVWDTNYLYNRVPHMFMWLLILGWVLFFSHTTQQKIVLSLIFIIIFAVELNLQLSQLIWIVGGGLILLWLPYVPMWRAVKNIMQHLSASAYYIYLTHMIFIHILYKDLGISSPLLNLIVSVMGGMFIWLSVQFMLQRLFGYWQGEKNL